MSDECPVCKKHELRSAAERQTQLCASCADSLGVIPMPAPRRPKVPCSKCNGLSFVRAVPREVSPMVGNEYRQLASPMAVTFGGQHAGWLGGINADPRRAFGLLEVYVCRGCGFVEWYCSDPEKIPIGPHFMTESLDYGAPAGPYR